MSQGWKRNTFKLGYVDGLVRIYTDEEPAKGDKLLPEGRKLDDTILDGWKLKESHGDSKLVMKDESEGWNNANSWTRTSPNFAFNISNVTGDDEDAVKKRNVDAATPDDNDNMTVNIADLIDPGGWKLLLLLPENVKVKMLCTAKI